MNDWTIFITMRKQLAKRVVADVGFDIIPKGLS